MFCPLFGGKWNGGTAAFLCSEVVAVMHGRGGGALISPLLFEDNGLENHTGAENNAGLELHHSPCS